MANPSRTTFLALTLLRDAIERARWEPLKLPEHGVRLALAYLWSISLSKDREPFDLLWKALLGKRELEKPSRLTWCGTQMSRICRDIGVAHDRELMEASGKADRLDYPQQGTPREHPRTR